MNWQEDLQQDEKKKVWEKEKMFVTRNFSFSTHSFQKAALQTHTHRQTK